MKLCSSLEVLSMMSLPVASTLLGCRVHVEFDGKA